jgi:Fe-S cluster assembly protein SufD
MTAVMERYETYASGFDAFRREHAFGPELLRAAREAAFARFLERGFPTTRDEEWRFTSVAPIVEMPFARPSHAPSLPSRHALEPFLFGAAMGIELVVVNGRPAPSLGSAGAPPAGVTIGTLSDLANAGAFVTPAGSPGPFADLNTAFFEDAVVIHIAPKAIVAEPLHVLFVSTSGQAPVMVAPRLVVVAGEQSQVTLVESYTGAGPGPVLTSAVTQIALGPGAVVEHVKIQRELSRAFHLASMFVRLERASTFASRSMTFGGRIARNDISAVLDGEGAECTLNGLYIGLGDALIDTHTTIDHAKAHCPSHEVYKGILGGRARAVFNGKIVVRPDAQKTDAKQTNKALLLTDNAQINTKPQLEIFADDVKCTHGAAIGQLDEDAMFYLRARGISEVDARSLLIHAFASDVLGGIRVAIVRERVQRVMEDLLTLPSA